MKADYAAIRQYGKLLRQMTPAQIEHLLFQFLFYRYWNYDLSKPFQEQFEHNQRQLLAFLQEQLAQNGGSMSQSRITGAVLLCWEDCTSILSKHLTTLLQRPIQLCRMVEDYDYWCVASINGRFSIPELHSLLDALSATTADFPLI